MDKPADTKNKNLFFYSKPRNVYSTLLKLNCLYPKMSICVLHLQS